MLQFSEPITINFPAVIAPNGTPIPSKTKKFINIPYITIDDPGKKIVIVRFTNMLSDHIVLWRDYEYDEIGNYSQDDVQNKILEILGINIQDSFQNLVDSWYSKYEPINTSS
jgi:hypothetical protein